MKSLVCGVEGCGVTIAFDTDDAESNAKAASHQLWKHPTERQMAEALLSMQALYKKWTDLAAPDSTADDLDFYHVLGEMLDTVLLLRSWAADDVGL